MSQQDEQPIPPDVQEAIDEITAVLDDTTAMALWTKCTKRGIDFAKEVYKHASFRIIRASQMLAIEAKAQKHKLPPETLSLDIKQVECPACKKSCDVSNQNGGVDGARLEGSSFRCEHCDALVVITVIERNPQLRIRCAAKEKKRFKL